MSALGSAPAVAAQVTPPHRGSARPQRVLSCVLCQQRKVRCDRYCPCATCVKAGAECVRATPQPRQRHVKLTERALLARIYQYEDLLRKNNIKFKPLRSGRAANPSISEDSQARDHEQSGSEALTPEQSSRQQSATESHYFEPRDLEGIYDSESDDISSGFLREIIRDSVFGEVWDKLSAGNDHLLFGTRQNMDLVTFHPGQAQIFRLWQIYLDNVNPLLKVTHTPTLQSRVIDAATDVTNIPPPFEALMFSIYCISVLSITEDECQAIFNTSREELLRTYHFGCQQALLNCGILRTNDRDCLTAFYLYIISVRPRTDPRSVSSILGVAVRIAQRLGISKDSTNTKKTVLEAEMDRRLWWSLSLFDTRLCEMSGFRTTAQSPSLTCRLPLNVNDFDLQPEMKLAPPAYQGPTEALFVVVRSELGNYLYQRTFELEFEDISTTRNLQEARLPTTPELSGIDDLEKRLENKFLSFCNPEIPLHFMTLWIARGTLARFRLEDYYTKFMGTNIEQTQKPTDLQRDAAVCWALNMLSCDTKVTMSPLTKGYVWVLNLQFPFFAYLHLCKELVQRPFLPNSADIWDAMSNNYEARFESKRGGGFGSHGGGDGFAIRAYFEQEECNAASFRIFAHAILSAWDAHEKALSGAGQLINPPRMVLRIQHRMNELAIASSRAQNENAPATDGTTDSIYPSEGVQTMNDAGFSISPMSRTTDTVDTVALAWGQTATNTQMNQVDWDMVDWNITGI